MIYHQKPIVVDHTIAAVGTGNLTKKYYATSPDAYILTTSTSDVAAIAATFDADFTDEHLAGAKLSARSGIASAGVRSTSRPSSVPTRPARPTAYASVGVAGTDAVFSTRRVAPDDRLAGAQDATCPESPCCRPAYPIRPLTKPDSLVAFIWWSRRRSACRALGALPALPTAGTARASSDRCRRSRSVGISVTSANRRPTDAARNVQVSADQPAGPG